jgi:hypothetical protein
MSALGQKQTLDWRPLMSALPPKADMVQLGDDVRFVPIADIDIITRVRWVTTSEITEDLSRTSKRHNRRLGRAGQRYHRSCTAIGVALSTCAGSLR